MDFLSHPPLRTTEDVTLVPKLGKLRSGSEAALKPLFYNAPMDSVASPNLLDSMIKQGEFAVVDRKLHINDPAAYEWLLKSYLGHPRFWLSVGLNETPQLLERIAQVVEDNELEIDSGLNILVDIAHGHMQAALVLYEHIAKNLPVANLMSGSICTPTAAIDCIAAGCTHVRVGVGPGAMCTTRLQTGVGVPNLSAVYSIASVVPEGTQIIADGGIKYPGQVAKYLAAGATGVMLGTRLAKAWESGGWHELPPERPEIFDPQNPPPRRYRKRHRGQASREYQQKYGCARLSSEGVGTWIDWEGESLEDILEEFRGGLRHAISYLGLTDVSELNPKNPDIEMLPITTSAYLEGTPHGI